MFKGLVLTFCTTIIGCPFQTTPGDVNKKQVYTQQEIIETMIPILKSEGKIFKKFKKIYAREAKDGEEIQTVTADGLETTNTAKAGDFIIKNQTDSGEMYIIGAEKFHARYDFLTDAEDGFFEYTAKGKVMGVEMNDDLLKRLNLSDVFYLIAPWGEEMVIKKDDFLVSPLDYSEVYRIAQKEFFETYKPDE